MQTETIIVFVNDAAYANTLLQPMLHAASQAPTCWVLVGCAPNIHSHISKWVSPGAVLSWQQSWADTAFARVTAQLLQAGKPQDAVHTRLALAQQNLCELTQALTLQFGLGRVLDARRPKLGCELKPVTAGQQPESSRMTGYATALAGAGLLAGLD